MKFNFTVTFYLPLHSFISFFFSPLENLQVISDVPADSLYRTERPPTKEIMRYFIRHKALRLGMGESSPWVVEDDLVKKFSLPSKLSDFLLHPHKVRRFLSCLKYQSLLKMVLLGFNSYLLFIDLKFLAENPSVKRKSLTSPDGRPQKKHKTSIASGKDSEGEKKKKNESNMPLSPFMFGSMQVSVLGPCKGGYVTAVNCSVAK